MTTDDSTYPPGDDDGEARLRTAIGRQVRQARRRRGLTGRRLAELAKITPASISQIELGQVTASVSTLLRITQALGITMRDLFDAGDTTSSGQVLHREDWPMFRPSTQSEMAVLAFDPDKTFELIWSRIAPGARWSNKGSTMDSTHVIFVLSGQLEIQQGDERHLLKAHSTYMFGGTDPRYLSNPGTDSAETLTLISPATF